MTYEDVKKEINKWLILKDQNVIKVLLAVILANRLPTNPVWLLLIAPPSHGKTALLTTLDGLPYVRFISDLTPATLLSGWKNAKGQPDRASLLPKIKDNTTIIMKDFGTILQRRRDQRAEIMAQLREVYDGKFSRSFGTGDTKDWNGKIGFFGGVTQQVELEHVMNSLLGERFVYYRMSSPPEDDVIKKSIMNSGHEKEMENKMQEVVQEYIESVKIPDVLPVLDKTYIDSLAFITRFTIRARTGVARDRYTREIIHSPEHESPARLVKQLYAIGVALKLLMGKFEKEEYEILIQIALDSVPLRRMKVINFLWKEARPHSTVEVATAIDYPTSTARRILEELVIYGILKRSKTGEYQSAPDIWEFTPDALMFLSMADSKMYNLEKRISSLPAVGLPPVDNPLDSITS